MGDGMVGTWIDEDDDVAWSIGRSSDGALLVHQISGDEAPAARHRVEEANGSLRFEAHVGPTGRRARYEAALVAEDRIEGKLTFETRVVPNASDVKVPCGWAGWLDVDLGVFWTTRLDTLAPQVEGADVDGGRALLVDDVAPRPDGVRFSSRFDEDDVAFTHLWRREGDGMRDQVSTAFTWTRMRS